VTQTQTHNVPSLRFPEFSGEWIFESLGNLSSKPLYGMNAAATAFDGKHKYIRITDIDDETRAYIPKPLTSPDGGIDKNYKLLKGDMLFARTGASTGRSYLYKEKDGDLYFAGFLVKFNVNKANPNFVYLQTFRHHFDKWVVVMSARSGQPGINAKEYSTFKFYTPPLPEQEKIASFLGAVDEKIGQLGRKKDLLTTYKKAMMQKLFSQEIRFKQEARSAKGATGKHNEDGKAFSDWEEKRLGDIATFTKGKGISKSDILEDGTTPCIRYGQLYTEYAETISSVVSRTNQPVARLVMSEKNDVIIPASGETALDIATASCVMLGGVALGGDLNIIRSPLNGVFLAYYLNSNKKIDIARLAQGTSVVHLYAAQLKMIKISIPSLPEQKKTANLLSAIDVKIDLVSAELSHAKAFKQGLLQQMFV
jgi:type I restriction enzyme S subunit